MKKFAIDNSAILYLALIRKHHTNIFRFTFTLTEEILPDLLQMAVNRAHRRFPTIFSGFRPGFFRYEQIPADNPPQVTPDPGLLINMTREEIAQCAYRIYYHGKKIHIEGFHAVTDGYGMIASFGTLVAEYLHLCYGIQSPAGYPVFDLNDTPKEEETEDSYLRYAEGTPLHMPSRYSYQLPGSNPKCGPVHTETFVYPVAELLAAARRYGVSITALLSAVMLPPSWNCSTTGKKRSFVRSVLWFPLTFAEYSPARRCGILFSMPCLPWKFPNMAAA